MPRLYHTKSKTGCERCRARRVKCDEAWPMCGGCRRHGIECNYDRLDSSGSASASPSSLFIPKDKGQAPSLVEGRRRRQRELRLIHFYTVRTSHTVPGTHIPELLEIWSNTVPELALEYEPLMNSIMAISSHHLAHEAKTPEEKKELLTLRAVYLEPTIQKHRVAVGGLNRQNADAASLTTVILTFDAFASLKERPLEPYGPPLHWFHLSRGIGGVTKYALKLLKDRSTAKIWPIVNSMLPVVATIDSMDTKPLAYLIETREGEMLDAEDVETYEETLRLLLWIRSGHEAGEELKMFGRRLISFPTMLPDHAVTLLERWDPRMMVLLAHFFALTSYASEFWWIGEMPKREILAMRAFLEPHWQKMLEWPMQVVTGGAVSDAGMERRAEEGDA